MEEQALLWVVRAGRYGALGYGITVGIYTSREVALTAMEKIIALPNWFESPTGPWVRSDDKNGYSTETHWVRSYGTTVQDTPVVPLLSVLFQ